MKITVESNGMSSTIEFQNWKTASVPDKRNGNIVPQFAEVAEKEINASVLTWRLTSQLSVLFRNWKESATIPANFVLPWGETYKDSAYLKAIETLDAQTESARLKAEKLEAEKLKEKELDQRNIEFLKTLPQDQRESYIVHLGKSEHPDYQVLLSE